MEQKCNCVYCGCGDLSKSDVFPDSFVVNKIIYKNVCRVEHNNKFSNEFETFAMNYFARFLKHFDVRGKNKVLRENESTVSFNGNVFNVKSGKEADMFNSVVKSSDGKALIGPRSILEKIPNKKEMPFNPNDQIVVTYTNDYKDLLDTKMKRFVSKIAFEFFCMKNDYCSRNDSEDLIDMIDFICDEKISDKLTIDLCFDKDAYKKMEKLPFGSHFISYSVNDDGILWHISFFGFVIYRLKLGVKPKTIKSKREFVLINFEEENISQDNSILYYFKCGDLKVPVFKEYAYVMTDVLAYLIQNDSSITSMEHDYNVLHEQYEKILNTIYITSRILKNFINDEYKLLVKDQNRFDVLMNVDSDERFYLYVLSGLGEGKLENNIKNINIFLDKLNEINDDMEKCEYVKKVTSYENVIKAINMFHNNN